MQNSLFQEDSDKAASSPLAHRLRPKHKAEFVGIDKLEKQYPFLSSAKPRSMIIYGPPGSGKTTLAQVLCSDEGVEFLPFSAVLSGVADLKKLFEKAGEIVQMHQRLPVIFIDEIHRFNKAQQDALLPHVESGKFVLIGATTENPKSSINKALLSRLQTVKLEALDFDDAILILDSVSTRLDIDFSADEIRIMAEYSGGDARKAIGSLELAYDLKHNDQFDIDTFKALILQNARSFDRNQDRHYDVISAFIKSMRGSDPDSALLWLAVMIDGGEDPVFIARRLVIFASEDVGNADLNALTVANNAHQVVASIGMPEARISLAQATTYLASTVKSNAAYNAINQALAYVESNATIDVPEHLRNFPAPAHPVKYQYPHAFENAFVEQQYSPDGSPQFYQPKDIGVERNIRNRLIQLWNGKKKYD